MLFLKTGFEVLDIIVENYSLVRLLPWNYDDIRRDLIKKDISIPCKKELDDKPYIWIAKEDMRITVKINCNSNIAEYYLVHFDIKAGFITDLASIPSAARFLIVRNDTTIIIGSIIHDICFATRCFGFKDSNLLFKHINESYSMGFFTSNIVYLAVKTPFAKSHYQTDLKKAYEAGKQVKISYTWR